MQVRIKEQKIGWTGLEKYGGAVLNKYLKSRWDMREMDGDNKMEIQMLMQYTCQKNKSKVE